MLTTESAAASARSALEAWQFGKDHGLVMWRKMGDDPMHAAERGREIYLKVALGNLAENVIHMAGEEADDAALLGAVDRMLKDQEAKLIRGFWFEERSSNLFKRGMAEIRCLAAAEFVRRMKRIKTGEESVVG